MTAKAEPHLFVGRSVRRTDGLGKVTGASRYVDDHPATGMLHAKTIRSTIACGKIVSIKFEPGIPWDEFTIVDHNDIPGENRVALIEKDQPVLCDGVVRHHEEPILLIAHPERGLVEKAARAVKITYEEEPGIFEIGQGNVFKEYLIQHNDVAAELAKSDIVLDEVYRTGAQEHVYIEPNGVIAWWDQAGVTISGSLQCPYYVHKAVKAAFKLPSDSWVNVIQDTTGGGFGGKEEFPSVLALHAALVSRKAGGIPTRLIYDREEDMVCSTKRHPSETHLRIGAMRDGTLRAFECDFKLDGGAYITLSPVVLSRGALHAFSVYKWPAATIRARAYFTNSSPYGAFRGFGAPQSLYAVEAAITQLAERLHMDPAELRRKNFLQKGDTMPTGQVLKVDPNMNAIMDRALELSNYKVKRAAWKRGGGKGIGISTFMHGAGFTGSGEVYLASRAALETKADGTVVILTSSTDIGQGTETVMTQIVAETLQIPMEHVKFHQPETRAVPNSGPTVASRTTMVVGRLVERAAQKLSAMLAGVTVEEHFKLYGPTFVEEQYEPPPGIEWNDVTYRGDAYATYAWACNVAEVTVDPVTSAVKVDHLTGTFDIGTVVNPTLAVGQLEGGIAQGIGWAMCEKVVLKKGIMKNPQMTNYILPTTVDIPDMKIDFLPTYWEGGAYGCKGVGELPMDGPAPAITAAISQAADCDIFHVPVLPEDILK
jgi:CO/xanthine dehydrogenase Mo-binding subunit